MLNQALENTIALLAKEYCSTMEMVGLINDSTVAIAKSGAHILCGDLTVKSMLENGREIFSKTMHTCLNLDWQDKAKSVIIESLNPGVTTLDEHATKILGQNVFSTGTFTNITEYFQPTVTTVWGKLIDAAHIIGENVAKNRAIQAAVTPTPAVSWMTETAPDVVRGMPVPPLFWAGVAVTGLALAGACYYLSGDENPQSGRPTHRNKI